MQAGCMRDASFFDAKDPAGWHLARVDPGNLLTNHIAGFVHV